MASLVGASTTMGVMLYHGVDPLDSMVRFNRTLYAGIKATMVYKRAEYVFGKDNPKFDALMEEAHGEIADILLELFLKQGGLYIKSGQYMASQDQSLPRAYKKLSVLQDSVEFKDFNIVEKTFEEEFGVSPFEMYKSVETMPIAAASIGQVHRAVTKDGNQVVIKVQYPEIRKRFSVDMFTYKVTLYLLEFIFKNAKLRWIGDEIEGFLHKELDFYNEAKNAERASNNFQGNLDYYIPKIYWDLTSKRILTLEYINGIKANDLEGIARLGLNRFDVANKVINCLAEQIFVHGFFHGDPHPGNVFVRRHPVKPGECQVVLLDHGLYKDMTPEARIRCCKLYRDIIIKDYKSFEATSKSIGIEDWKKLAFIILMRPLDNSMFEKHFPGMSVKDIHKFMTENRTLFAAKMEKIMLEEMDGWNKLMSNLPKEFLILIRNWYVPNQSVQMRCTNLCFK